MHGVHGEAHEPSSAQELVRSMSKCILNLAAKLDQWCNGLLTHTFIPPHIVGSSMGLACEDVT